METNALSEPVNSNDISYQDLGPGKSIWTKPQLNSLDMNRTEINATGGAIDALFTS